MSPIPLPSLTPPSDARRATDRLDALEPDGAPRRRPDRAAARWLRALGPGVLLCIAISLLAWMLQVVEERWVGRPFIEALVLAILLGTAIRTAWTPGARWERGVAFSAKQLLEVAVFFLGVSVNLPLLLRAGPMLLVGIIATVAVAIPASYTISRALGLHHQLALLVACGNSICGNSAIAAVAPVIHAEGKDIASSIAFTAILGVVMVLALPFLALALGLSHFQYGVVAGLTVYAVPQVLAATFPVSALSGQVGTLVKLVRVLMLGPVVVTLALTHRERGAAGRIAVHRLVPWFIVGFLGLAALRSLGLVPEALVPPLRTAATALTVLSMAALGLGVDVRVLGRVGGRVTTAVIASLAVLIVISVALVRTLHLG